MGVGEAGGALLSARGDVTPADLVEQLQALVRDLVTGLALSRANQAGFNLRLRQAEGEIKLLDIDVRTLADDVNRIDDA